MPDPETGEPINVSHMIPRSIADLQRRHACLQTIAEFTVGLMGRTPDYMNVTFAGFAGRADEWAVNGNERGAANLVAYQKLLARNDLSLTHTIVHPTIDKSRGDVPAPGNEVALHKVADTAHGIVVRGARILATLAPFADEIAVYPAMPLAEGTDAYALSFCIPMGTPGLKFLCRDSCSTAPNRFDHPLSSRFDEQDAFVIFDDVEVPRDRVFINANRAAYNTVMTTGWYPEHHAADDDSGADQARVRLRARDRDGRSDQRLVAGDPQMLGEIWTYAEFARAAIHSAEAEAFEYGNGVWFPNGGPLAALRAILPTWFPRVGEIITLIGSHNLLAAPTQAQLDDPTLRPLIDRYLRGARDIDRRGARAHLPAGVGLRRQRAGRPQRTVRALLSRLGRAKLPARDALASKERARRLVDQVLGLTPPAPVNAICGGAADDEPAEDRGRARK